MSKVKIIFYSIYAIGVMRKNYSKVIEDTPENRRNFIVEECGLDEDCDWYESFDDFVNGKINSLECLHEDDWDSPTGYRFEIATYEEELKRLELELDELKRDFGKDKGGYIMSNYTKEAIKEYVGLKPVNVVLEGNNEQLTGYLITFNDIDYHLLPLGGGDIYVLKRSHIKKIIHLNGVVIPKEIKK